MSAVAARRIAGYPIEAVLGRGRHSSVYLAWQGAKAIALKVTGASGHGFTREFEVAGALAHPCVIAVLDHGVDGDASFLAMDYAAGGSIAALDDRLAPAAAARIFQEAVEAAAWVHRNGWVHRDLKPANLLVRADGSLALGDFGCARRAGSRDPLEAGTVVGTPRHAAPEQHCGTAAHPSADVYSLGVLLHELLTGRAPYPGVTLAEIVSQHLCAPLPELPQPVRAWQPLLHAMLAKDPRNRLPDGDAVLAQLRQVRRLRESS